MPEVLNVNYRIDKDVARQAQENPRVRRIVQLWANAVLDSRLAEAVTR